MAMYPHNDLQEESKIMHESSTATSANGGTRQRNVTLALDYARLSMNRGGKSDNCAIQHRENIEFIEDSGWKLGQSFEDDDISASKYSTKPRPDFQRMLTYIQAYTPPANAAVKLVIIVTEMPRLYRQVEELLVLIKMAETTYLKGIYTTDGETYDLSTPEGIHRAIGAVNNAMLESNKLSKRQTRKKKAQASQGKWSGGGRPYGYEADGITIRDPEAKIIMECVERIIAGETLAVVARSLNARGDLTSTGKHWMLSNLRRMLIKKRYVIIGRCPLDTEGEPICEQPCAIPHAVREHEPENGGLKGEYPAIWPGIITPEDYQLMLGQLSRQTKPAAGKVKGRVYLLSGIAECGGTHHDRVCAAAMYGQNRKLASGNRQRRYRCKSNDNHGLVVGCGRVFRDTAALDAFVKEAVLFRLDTPAVAAALATKGEEDQAKQLAQDLLKLRLRRKDINQKLALVDDDEAEDLNEQLGAVRGQMEKVQAKLSQIQQQTTMRNIPGNGELRRILESGDIETQRSIIKLVVGKIIVKSSSSNKPVRWNGHQFNPSDVEIIWSH